MTLEEVHNMWSQSYNLYNYFDETDTQVSKASEKSQTFLDKFYKNAD